MSKIKQFLKKFSSKEENNSLLKLKEEISELNKKLDQVIFLCNELRDKRKKIDPKGKQNLNQQASQGRIVFDLHGNPVPVKETMTVRKYSDGNTLNRRKCKVWGCNERVFQMGYCEKHFDKYKITDQKSQTNL
jgi:hypothetical protein